VFVVLVGRRHAPRGPWTYNWHADVGRYRRRPRGRRGPGGYWA
jgi:hypothetical protein